MINLEEASVDHKTSLSRLLHNNHYKSGFEVIDIMLDKFSPEQVEAFLLLNATKYLLRCEHKGQKESDLYKAENYLHRMRTGEWLGE